MLDWTHFESWILSLILDFAGGVDTRCMLKSMVFLSVILGFAGGVDIV